MGNRGMEQRTLLLGIQSKKKRQGETKLVEPPENWNLEFRQGRFNLLYLGMCMT